MYYDIKKSGQRIRQLRERRKETQETLSEKLNISLSLLRKIETGRRGTSIEVLIVFAEYFDTSLDYIVLGRTNSPSDFKDKLRAIIDNLEEIEHKL